MADNSRSHRRRGVRKWPRQDSFQQTVEHLLEGSYSRFAREGSNATTNRIAEATRDSTRLILRWSLKPEGLWHGKRRTSSLVNTEEKMSTMPKTGMLDRPGAQIFYALSGPPTGLPVVFTHGATLDHRMWAEQTCFADEHRVLTYDIRCHGRSKAMVPFRFQDAVDDLEALLDMAGFESPILVGQSMGGNISQEVVFRAPSRARAIALLGCACNTWSLSTAERWFGRLGVASIALYPPKALINQIARRSSVKPDVQAYLAAAASPMSPREVRDVLASLLTSLHPAPDYVVPIPELIMRGEHDQLGNFRKVMPQWAQRDPNALYKIIPDGSHCANQDNPRYFNRLLKQFIDDQ